MGVLPTTAVAALRTVPVHLERVGAEVTARGFASSSDEAAALLEATGNLGIGANSLRGAARNPLAGENPEYVQQLQDAASLLDDRAAQLTADLNLAWLASRGVMEFPTASISERWSATGEQARAAASLLESAPSSSGWRGA